MANLEYRNLAISGTISVITTPIVGGVVMGYLEQGTTSHNIFSGAIVGILMALLLGVPYSIFQAYMSVIIGGELSATQSLGLFGLVTITFIAMGAAGGLLGGFIARQTRT